MSLRTERIMRIAYLVAGYSDPQYEELLSTKLQGVAGVGNEVLVEAVPSGPFTLEHRYYLSLVIPDLVHRAYSLRNSVDAIVMGGGLDPAVKETRELVDIPVVGAGEAGLHVAALLGNKFSVLTGRRSLVPKVEALVTGHGLQSRLASIRPTSLSVEELRELTDESLNRIGKSIACAVEEDGAEVIVSACGSLGEAFAMLKNQFSVPLIDSRLVALKLAIFLADLYQLGICYTSRIGLYEAPRILPDELTKGSE
jgi:allantoin racemase